MASGRIINITSLKPVKILGTIIIASTIVIGCGTTQSTQREPNGGPSPSVEPSDIAKNELSEDFLEVMNESRSELEDAYFGIHNFVPAVFKQVSQNRDIGDPGQGYRIQILSTRNVNQADEMANNFRLWARQNLTDYIPKVYVVFRQPYYKVHVGNFQFYDHALRLNRVLKNQFPDAWVVHDEVEPELVPPDSADFQQN